MTDGKCVKEMIKLFFPYKKRLVCILLSMILSSIISIVIPIISQNIVDLGFVQKDINIVVKLSIVLLCLYSINILIDIGKEKNRLKLSADFTEKLNKDFFSHIINIKADCLENKNSTEILTQAEIDVSAIASLADEKIFYVLTKILSMIGGFVGLCVISKELAIMVLTFIPIKAVLISKLSKKRGEKYNDYLDINGKYSSWLGETIAGLNEIRNFGIKKEKEKELIRFQKSINKADYEINMLSEYNGSVDTFLLNILQILIYISGIYLIVNSGLSVGSIFAFVTYSGYVTEPVISVLNILFLLSGVIPSAKRYFAFRDKEEEEDQGNIIPSDKFHNIRIENLCFSYSNSLLFENLSFEICSGEKVAIIGGNGVGKSTLLKLIMRVYKPSSGKITLNDIPIEEYDLEQYRKIYSVVNQNVYLFNASIKENILLYEKEDFEKLEKSLENSGLVDFISFGKLNDMVGDNGIKLSGGQRQRIALARAFYRDKEVCILDEANSSVDIYYEKQLEELLLEEMKDKTLIMITHRLDILSKVDKIIFLKPNSDYVIGGYQDLIKNDQEFKHMILNSQD